MNIWSLRYWSGAQKEEDCIVLIDALAFIYGISDFLSSNCWISLDKEIRRLDVKDKHVLDLYWCDVETMERVLFAFFDFLRDIKISPIFYFDPPSGSTSKNALLHMKHKTLLQRAKDSLREKRKTMRILEGIIQVRETNDCICISAMSEVLEHVCETRGIEIILTPQEADRCIASDFLRSKGVIIRFCFRFFAIITNYVVEG